MKHLPTELPDELRKRLRDIVCEACNGAKGSGETCDWRAAGHYCSVPDEAAESMHKAYYEYQMKELGMGVHL